LPTYQYKCSSCQEELEVFQKITDEKLTTCPACNNETLDRVVAGGGFILKGGGWYKDGYSDTPKK
jgi:putative FmdB family regulatory protein